MLVMMARWLGLSIDYRLAGLRGVPSMHAMF